MASNGRRQSRTPLSAALRRAVVADPGSASSVSELTTPSGSRNRREGAEILASLAGEDAESPETEEPDTPIRALLELDEEEDMEAKVVWSIRRWGLRRGESRPC